MLRTAPDPVDVQNFRLYPPTFQDLQFKLLCRLKAFDNKDKGTFSKNCNLITAASRFGLIFIGSAASSFQVVQSKSLENLDCGEGDASQYSHREITLPSPAKFISTNCEHTILAVVVERDGCPWALFYDVKSFWSQNVAQIEELRLSVTPGVTVLEVNWNPALGSIFTACKSDGTLGVYELKNPGIDINELPAASGATCFCWSPKGKQIAVGSRDGKITQYKPDLKAVKVINAPPLKEAGAILSLKWISNYQFVGVYQPPTPLAQASLIVIDVPKAGDPSFTNYDDICYSSGSNRPPQFFMILLQQWNILMIASSNSMEVGVLGLTGMVWTQWTMGDAARAELPLSSDHEETLPIGFAIDIGSTRAIPWEESVLPPAPLLLLLSHHGTLCCFNVINLKQGMPTICTPPDHIADTSGLQWFVMKKTAEREKQNIPSTPPVAPAIQLQQTLGDKPAQPKMTKTVTFAPPPVSAPAPTTVLAPVVTVPTPFHPGNLVVPKPPLSTPINMFRGQVTLTPINQQPIQEQKSATPPAILAALSNQSTVVTSTPSTHVPQKPIVPEVLKQPLVFSQTKIKADIDAPKLDSSGTDIKDDAESELLYAQMVKEECVFLESELKALLHQGRSFQYNLGTEADKTNLLKTTEALEEFLKEVVDISTGQSGEVHSLKQNLLQSFAWYEEARSRHLAFKDETLAMLMRAQPLDSASEKQLQDIRHLGYYLESQLAQANRSLDEQWDGFQDYCRETVKMQMPTMETIFQAMVKQNAIIQKQSYILKDIGNRIKSKAHPAVGPSLVISVDNPEKLEEELKRLRLNSDDIGHIQYQHVMKRTKNVTQTKVDKLRNFLTKREYPHVPVIKPQLLSSSSILQASPSSKLRLETKLAAESKLAAVPKAKDVVTIKKLDFAQSTPKPLVNTKTDTPPNTPIDGLQNFTYKFEMDNFKPQQASGFVSVAKTPTMYGMKTSLPSGPSSAFVSTSYGSSTSVTAPVTSLAASKSMTLGTSTPKTAPSYILSSTNTTVSQSQPVITIFTKAPAGSGTSIQGLNATSSAETTTSFGVASDSAISTSMAGSKPLFNFLNQSSGNKTAMPSSSAASIFGSVSSSTSSAKVPAIASTTATSVFQNFKFQATEASSIFAPSTTPTTVFGSAESSKPMIFGSTATTSPSHTTKPTENAASWKPFTFSTTTAAKTTATYPAAQPLNFSAQLFNFGSASEISKTSSNKVSTPSTKPSIFGAFNSGLTVTPTFSAVPATSGTTVVPSSTAAIPCSTVGNSTATLTAASSTPATTSTFSFIQSTAVSTPSTKPSIFGAFNSGLTVTPIFNAAATTSSSTVVPSSTTAIPCSTVGDPTVTLTAASSTPATTSTFSFIQSAAVSPSTSKITSGTIATTPPISILGSPIIMASQSPVSITIRKTETITSPIDLSQSSSISITEASVIRDSSSSPGANPFTNTTTTVASTPKSSSFIPVSTSATQSSIFGTPTKPLSFGSDTVGTSQSSPFAASSSTTTSSMSGSGSTTIFGAPTATTSTKPLIFGTTSTSIFSAPPSAAAQASVFGTVSTTTPPSSMFESTLTTNAQNSAFGARPVTSQTSIFGTAPPPTVQESIFGNTSTTTSHFGNTPTTSSQGSLFGSAPTTSSQVSVFGAPPSGGSFGDSTTPKSSVFGNVPVSTQSSIFGGGTGQTALFGNNSAPGTFGGAPTTSVAPSPFGQSPSVFGQTPAFSPTPASTFDTTNSFGTPATTSIFSFNQSSGSVFGGATTTSGSIFGNTPTTSSAFGSGGSIFGTPSSSSSAPFGAPAQSTGSVFAPASSQQSSSFSFAAAATNSPAGSFGFGALNVDSTPTTSSGFAFSNYQPATTNPFGISQEHKSSFGGDSKSIFGSPAATSSSSIFGSTSSTFGSGFGTSAFGNQAQSGFGQTSTFGGSSAAGSFSSNSTPGPFSAATAAGGATVSQSGFGGNSAFQNPSGFGGAPVFGSNAPAFGGAPSFGGAPAFGGAPSFGTPPKVFGASAPSGFGSPVAAQTTSSFGNLANQPTVGFESLANQQTVGFGNLAQQASNPPVSNTSFSGTSSFSSWR